MAVKRLLIIFGFLLALLWGANQLKKAATRLQFEVFNKPVIVKVVELPICGRSNIIGISYKEKKYNISINKNDCIQGKYNIGDTLEATYNSKLDEMNPGNFVGTYKLNRDFMILVGIVFLLYLFLSNRGRKSKKR
ncbi:hypothetical protein [Phaeodactylibacter luteus]|uniref:Uncharacterized protein n=1 Tax=Phaeodactylibacter luteus TaxID=1564516 RepID=A0A5C6RG58_9BACT|nr:hypothetical protein [Phaeodactylibacter luteus]TXB59445.1 hypothetical protein FRY97_21185 [Phaeodactylibacter luteus]